MLTTNARVSIPLNSLDKPSSKKSEIIKITATVICCFIFFIILVVIGIGVGVGVGVGLTKNKETSATDTVASSSNEILYPIRSAPSVDCIYNGSSTCGCSAIKPSFASPRIINGYAAVPHSWPWIVAILLNDGRSLCGGFLITYQHVVTAAHCVANIQANSIQVYAGIKKLSERTNGQSRGVSSYVQHPSYSSSQYINDIAVLTLSSPFDRISTIGLCCLPSVSSLPSIGTAGVIAGWGVTSASSTNPSDELLQAVIEVKADSSTCSTGASSSVRFCASYSGTAACFGDSGSPLMIAANNSWTCAGIVSSSRQCTDDSWYTRVSAFRPFIYSITNV